MFVIIELTLHVCTRSISTSSDRQPTFSNCTSPSRTIIFQVWPVALLNFPAHYFMSKWNELIYAPFNLFFWILSRICLGLSIICIIQPRTFKVHNSIKTQSVYWVRQSNQSNSVHGIMFHWFQWNTMQLIAFDYIRLPNSIELKPMDCIWLRLVNKFTWMKVMLCSLKNSYLHKKTCYMK